MQTQFWRVAEFDRETGKCKALGTWCPDRSFVTKVWREVKINNDNQVVIETTNTEPKDHTYRIQH